jgi:uncharacterized protein (TIGR03435 family)
MLKHCAFLIRTLIASFSLTSMAGLCRQKADTAVRPEFEVASIKLAQGNSEGARIRPLPGDQTYIAEDVPVKLMIKLMFHLCNSQIEGGPHWLDTNLYDVEAKADRPQSIDELHIMFQNLLVDRFKLRYHEETRVLPAYELVVDKSGIKMTVDNSPERFDIPPIEQMGPGMTQGTRCPMSHFAWMLSQVLRRPVVDETKLVGFYDFELNWNPYILRNRNMEAALGEHPPTVTGPDIFTALREQLGLRLESHKAPVQVMVIDHVERPSANSSEPCL